MKEKFVNLYQLQKTLRFSLIPEGKTEEMFEKKNLLEEDEKRAEAYEKVKKFIDAYHKKYIEDVLSQIKSLDGLNEYAELYNITGKSDKETDRMQKLEENMRKQIAKALTSGEEYKKLTGNKELVRELLPGFLQKEEDREIVAMFNDFSTYFVGFQKNRENMYSAEGKSTEISYRCVSDNLPKFLDNIKSFSKIAERLPDEVMNELNENYSGLFGVTVNDMFTVDYFAFALSQSEIEKYNQVIGGYTCSDGTKVKGINEYVNLYNQNAQKNERLPQLKALFKQILSDKDTVSFVPEKFVSDDEVLTAIKKFYLDKNDGDKSISDTIEEIKKLFESFEEYGQNGIFVSSGLAISNLSNKVFGYWDIISDAWEKEYEAKNPIKAKEDPGKYLKKEKDAYKKISSFSVEELQKLANGNENAIVKYYSETVLSEVAAIRTNYEKAFSLLNSEYRSEKKLCSNETAIEQIKDFLDSIKELEHTIKPLLGTGKEENKNEVFYGKFVPLYVNLSAVDRLYDKVRNYVTQKPYSLDKIKLNFQNSQLLNGWDRNKEKDYRTVILRKDGNYYLAIMDKINNKAFAEFPVEEDGEYFEKMEYKLLPGPNKMLPKVFFADSNLDFFKPPKEIIDIKRKETFKKGENFSLSDCHKLIDFFKESIAKHEDWSKFGFEFSPTESYNDISDFYREVSEQGYSLKFVKVSAPYIEDLVNKGELYLFRIYNKDFSSRSHGKPNLHTMYFKMLFDEQNLSDVVYKLNGQAEMFYRKASIKDKEKIVHTANRPIKNKNPDNPKTESTFDYDITKDRRFTKRQFEFHLPITVNYKATGKGISNFEVREELKKAENQHVIGIDRGERNLLYVCVIDGAGKIVFQKSMNDIVSDNGYKVDYHELLDRKEKERDEKRKSWGTIENIKELKSGYLSQVIHEISELVVKYDAIIAMEDLNSGFKNSRAKVEKQVYQKFEHMLADKLSYLMADKSLDPNEEGGLFKAYQFANPAASIKGYQNGIIFYIPAWLTSKIDPVTGFADLLYAKYTSVKEAEDLFSRFDDIRYNEKTDMFEFDIDYCKFKGGSIDTRCVWTVCTNGDRIRTFRNPEKNNEFDNEIVYPTEKLKALFDEHGIDFRSNLKEKIVSMGNKDFYKKLIGLLNLTLQMRNSITGDTKVDYLISPVRDNNGNFFDSRNFEGNVNAALPGNADANGAYNIARKALWAVNQIKASEDVFKARTSIGKKEWLAFVENANE